MTSRRPDSYLDLILDLKLRDESSSGATTVRDWLHSLLTKVWTEAEGFDGKRPWGQSGWRYELAWPLWNAGFIQAEYVFEPGGMTDGSDLYELKSLDDTEFDALVIDLIDRMCSIDDKGSD